MAQGIEWVEGVIVKGIGGSYSVSADSGQYTCTARGIFRNRKITPMIGDHVSIRISDEGSKEASIEQILPRKNQMHRPKVANVDMAVIVLAAARPALNRDLLDKLIILIENESLDIVVCINKIDLDQDGAMASLGEAYRRVGYPVVLVSAQHNDGLAALKPLLANKVTVFAGPSGVGKSSVINAVMPGAGLATGALSRKIDRGKHTTRHVALLEAFPDSYVVDTPGFTSLSFDHIDRERLPFLFKEFRPYLGACRFNNCRHIKEMGCSVREHIGHTIMEERYESFVMLADEMQNGKRG